MSPFFFFFLHQIYTVYGLPDLYITPTQLITGFFSLYTLAKNSESYLWILIISTYWIKLVSIEGWFLERT